MGAEIVRKSVFNTPLEISLRLLVIINTFNKPIGLDRLNIYDYLLVNSGDIPDAPESLHPATPIRNAQLYVKREKIQKGLELLLSKELIELVFDNEGIRYKSSHLTRAFLDYFDSAYYNKTISIAKWLSSKFNEMEDRELNVILKKYINNWDEDFSLESLFLTP